MPLGAASRVSVMGFLALVERFLSRRARPAKPASSVFGAEADREIADRSRAEELEFEIEKEKGRPRGM